MKTTKIIVIFFVLATLISCKPNDWLDWKTQNEIWLQENAKKEGVKTTSSGLQYKCIVPGIPQSSGNVDDNKIVKINYTGKLINGYDFDSSEGYENYVNAFVPGFVEGLKLMKEFGIYELYIPHELGYGAQGMGSEGTISHIPPYSTLIFRVELLDVY
ncbi:MAG: FKBP-type peptidyl-prolyl cis-trans isomerase [Paludibacteraceae bacterium]|nr:FKBP-type peptidyl-prolyl cis-trans isomerase [Paludibacteraceae bacterium]